MKLEAPPRPPPAPPPAAPPAAQPAGPPEISAAELRALFAAHGERIAMGVALRHFTIKEKGTPRFKQLVQLLKEHTTTVEKGMLQLKQPI